LLQGGDPGAEEFNNQSKLIDERWSGFHRPWPGAAFEGPFMIATDNFLFDGIKDLLIDNA
jgi:hypothetical protein